MKRFWAGGGSGGVSTVEFALVAPLLIVLLLGVLDVAIAINAYATVANASREGAHYAISHPTAAPSAIASQVASRIVPLAPERVTVTTSYYDGATFRPWPADGLPLSSPTARPIPVRVEVSYPWSASTVLIGAFFRGDPLQVASRSTMEARY